MTWPPPERGDRCVWTGRNRPYGSPWAACGCGWWRSATDINVSAVALDHASRCAVVAHRIQRARVRA